MPLLLQRLAPLLAPLLVLGAAAAAARVPSAVATVGGLAPAAPLVALTAALLLAWRFMHVRAVAQLLALGLAHAPLLLALQGPDRPAVVALLALALPLSALALALLPYRPVLHPVGALRALVLVAPAATAALAPPAALAAAADAARELLPGTLGPGVPTLALIPTALAVVTLAALAVHRRDVPGGACAGAVAASLLALVHADDPATAALWLGAGGLAVFVGLLQASWRMAFLDPLTGLPGRRALDEQLDRLAGRYAIAMVDIDHFKRFNDTFGHDIGDQALRKVAATLPGVGGGGRAYRYGGEEFALVFPGSAPEAIAERCDALRQRIENDPLTIRMRGRVQRGKKVPPRERRVPITVSIGVAGSAATDDGPEAVVKLADKALYKAKKKGRNQVVVG